MAAFIPAICKQCGLLFDSAVVPGGVSIKGNVRATFIRNKVTCPNCHESANIIDGVYEIFGDAQRISATSAESAAQLDQLLQILKSARQKGSTSEEIKQEIEAKTPAYILLAQLFSQKNRLELWAILAVVIAYLTYVQEHPNSQPSQQIAETIISRCAQDIKPRTSSAQPKPNRRERRAAKSRARHK